MYAAARTDPRGSQSIPPNALPLGKEKECLFDMLAQADRSGRYGIDRREGNQVRASYFGSAMRLSTQSPDKWIPAPLEAFEARRKGPASSESTDADRLCLAMTVGSAAGGRHLSYYVPTNAK